MPDDQKQRAAPVTMDTRASPLDRVKQIQEMQRAMEAAPVQTPVKAAEAAPAQAPVASPATSGVFEASAVLKAATDIKGERPSAAEHAEYAKAQVDPSQLFGAGTAIEVTGNPWKVISFATMLPVVFDPPGPLGNYEPKFPEKAVKTEEGLLFSVTIAPKSPAGGEQKLSRAVMTAGDGQLKGAECKNPDELKGLLGRAGSMAQAVLTQAFGKTQGANIGQVAVAPRGGFQVTVSKGSESKTVAVNNFGMPLAKGARSVIDVAGYFLDKFDAAA